MNDCSCLAFVRRVAGTAAITALLTTIAAPAFAASPTTPTPSPFSPAAVAKVVARTVVSSEAAPAVAATTAPAKAKAEKQAQGSFMKSKVGVLVAAVFAVGTGYAIYSAREDRIRGLNR
jgi:hypothetical protein